MAKLVTKTYGEALFELAVETGTVDTVMEEVKVVIEIFKENPELFKLLNHPKISKEEKITVIENIFKGKFSDTIVGFLVLIVDKGRYNEINGIFDCFMYKVKELKNIGIAYVTSAIELSEEEKKNIEKKLLLTTKYVGFEMNYAVDKSIIGGLVIRIGDRVVDSSIKTKIENLAKDLSRIQLA